MSIESAFSRIDLPLRGSSPNGPSALREPDSRSLQSRRNALAFWVLVPLSLGLPLGLFQVGVARQLDLPLSLALWSATSLASWYVCAAGTWLASRLLAPLHAPLLLLLVAGSALNVFASSYYMTPLLAVFVEPGLVSAVRVARHMDDPAYLLLRFKSGTPGMLIWIGANLFYRPRWWTVARGAAPAAWDTAGSIEPTKSAAPAGDALPDSQRAKTLAPERDLAARQVEHPALLRRLTKFPDLSVTELVALEADDHYIHVHTTRGSELVYCRLSDAIRELAELPGLRVHRSFWVHRPAVRRVQRKGRNMSLLMQGGLQVPVSGGYLQIAQRALAPSPEGAAQAST
jgi:hypothetical protein